MSLPPEKIAEIRDRSDIAQIIGEHVALKRAGSSLKGLCPFHSEKSPSFHVNPARQMFKCFGCQAGGDVFSFMMKIDGRSFPEVARALAERAGVDIPVEDARENVQAREERARKDRLVAAMDAAAGFYLRMLREHPLGHFARDAIDARQVSIEVAGTYRLGYAPHGWDALAKHLQQKGIAARDAEDAGLLVPRRSGDGYYDRFRHRLMFPISDLSGNVIAFSGRALPTPPGEKEPDEAPAKYVNSPEGPLYRKGELLFGLHEARVELRRTSNALLCEGNFDVVSIHQAGHKNVVAPLGTAFTLAQAKLLRRYVATVFLIFDGDAAGKKATAAAFPLLQEAGLSAKVVALPRGEDPDSFARNRGAAALTAMIEAARPIVEHLIEAAADGAGRDPSARAAAIESLAPVMAAVTSPVEHRLYLERIAAAFEVPDLRAVEQQLRRGARSATPVRRPNRDQPSRDPSRGEPDHDHDQAGHVEAPAAAVPERRRAPAPALEKDVVQAYLDHPALFATLPIDEISTLLTSGDLRAILRHSAASAIARGTVDGPALLAAVLVDPSVSPAARQWLEERLVVQTFDATSAEPFVRRAVELLGRQQIERELKELASAIKRANDAGDLGLAEELMREHTALFRKGGGRA